MPKSFPNHHPLMLRSFLSHCLPSVGVTFGTDYGKQLDTIIENGDKSNELLREIKEAIKLGG